MKKTLDSYKKISILASGGTVFLYPIIQKLSINIASFVSSPYDVVLAYFFQLELYIPWLLRFHYSCMKTLFGRLCIIGFVFQDTGNWRLVTLLVKKEMFLKANFQ